MTQNAEILAHLKSGKPITQLSAFNEYGCFRLGARIHDLKREGLNITKRMVTHPRTGKHFAEYRLVVS